MVCKHCGITRKHKARGLCSTCFRLHKSKYPLMESKHREAFEPIPPRGFDYPTHHPPGSPGKVEAMVRRVEQGLYLWNPLDAIRDDSENILIPYSDQGDEMLDFLDDGLEAEVARAG